MLIGIYLATEEERDYMYKKLLQYVILIICISTIIVVYQMAKKPDVFANKEFEEIVKMAYENGRENMGGGALGAVFAVPLIKGVGAISTVIIAARCGTYFIHLYFWCKTIKIYQTIY